MSDLNHIIQSQQGLLSALERAAAGELTVAELKPFSGAFGILPQRNDMLATRIRITGGELSLEKFQFLAALAEEIQPGYIHVSSRQNIQFHDVMPADAAIVIRKCTENGLPYRGGGGDSLRNLAVSALSGVAADGSADLVPYAQFLTDVMFDWEEAFHLPRKLKIAFASAGDAALALRQDLGFIETRNQAGEFGFKVVGGGGFGRNPAVAITLLEFISPADLARAARAMVKLFSEHGNRTNRAVARIRYIVANLGPGEFVRLYLSYYDSLQNESFLTPPLFDKDWNQRKESISCASMESAQGRDFLRWKEFAVRANRFSGEASVTLFVPQGILSVAQFRAVADLLQKLNVSAVRLTMEQNILIPSISDTRLSELFLLLRNLSIDLMFNSFRGRLETCIGATVCKAGILNTPVYGVAVGEALDEYFRDYPARLTADRALQIVHSVRFSGCPSSCVSQQAVRFGFQGIRRKVGEVLKDGFTLWENPRLDVMGKEDPAFIPAEDLPDKVIALLEEAKIL